MIEEKENRFESFKQGNEYVFRYYYEKYYHALCLSVSRCIKEEAPMHDIVQDAFIILWKSRESIESELHLKMFLYQVVRNHCLNYLKNRRIRERYVHECLALEEEGAFTEMVIEEEVHRLVIQEIEHLPDEQKKVVYLHLKGENNIKIAEILNVSVNTVKTHKARARKTLKYRLGDLFVSTILISL